MGTAKAGLIPLTHSIGPSQSVKRRSKLAFEKPRSPQDLTGRSSPQKGLFHLLFDGSLQPILNRKFKLTLLLCNLAIHFDD